MPQVTRLLKRPRTHHGPLKRHLAFLREVFILAVSAFGGPQAHIAMVLKNLVRRKKYLTEKELIELMALCQMLPGPTSTQTITAIGYRRGGPVLALLTLLIWATPAVLIMAALAFGYHYMATEVGWQYNFLKYLRPMAVGFVLFAAVRLAPGVVKSPVHGLILAGATLIAILFPTSWIFPLLLLGGGLVTNFTSQEQAKPKQAWLRINWNSLWLFLGIWAIAVILGNLTKARPVLLFENTYRFGSIIFGGGQVLVPMMHEHFVSTKAYLSSKEFLNGYGFVQALPGPVFSFSTFVGILCMQSYGPGGMLLGGLIGAVAIFLPGTLIIFFVYPVWENLKKYRVVTRSLEGINAAACGVVAAAAYLLMKPIGFGPANLAMTVLTVLLLMFTRIPSPFIVLGFVLAGLGAQHLF